MGGQEGEKLWEEERWRDSREMQNKLDIQSGGEIEKSCGRTQITKTKSRLI